MTHITKIELINSLNGIDKPTFTNVTMETTVRMNKTGNPYFERVKKLSTSNYLLGSEYGKRVIKNEEKEGIETDFILEEMKGKKHISKCVCVDTKTEETFYVMLERFDEIKPKVEYICDGNSIEKTLFEDYMTKVYESKKQGQEKKVMVITPKIDNIKKITINKEQYEII